MLTLKKKHRKKLFLCGMLIVVLGLVGTALLLLFPPTDDAPSVPKLTPQTPTDPPREGYKPTDFYLDENGFMACLTADCDTGIDVSEYQKEVDWEKVKAAGVDFVFIRLGCRGSTEGNLYTDSMAKSHYEGAKAAGLQIGMYFYSQAITVEEAEEEAAFVLENMEGYTLDLPFIYDWEWGGEGSRTDIFAPGLQTVLCKAFCQDIAAGGLSPMIYFNKSQGLRELDLEELQDYPFWLALYDDTLDFPHTVSYWQYTDQGRVDGIEGNVDLNLRLPA